MSFKFPPNGLSNPFSAGFWRHLGPAPQTLSWHERLRGSLGGLLGIAFAAWLCRWGLAWMPDLPAHWPWMVAPLGASAVLVFAAPASPLAQPWPVVLGNTISALVGIGVVQLLGSGPGSAAVAVSLAIFVMFALRCLHPPGGAAALLMVLGGVDDWRLALFPVLCNSLLLVLSGMVYGRISGRPYPQGAGTPSQPASLVPDPRDADIEAAIASYDQVLDISRADLKALLEAAHLHHYQRQLRQLRCADLMSRKLITASPAMLLRETWPLFRLHRIKALPVLDETGALVGILTPADCLRAAGLAWHSVLEGAIAFDPATPGLVGDAMCTQVQTTRADQALAVLVPLFARSGHHHLPVLDDQERLVGIITQTDVMAALCPVEDQASG